MRRIIRHPLSFRLPSSALCLPSSVLCLLFSVLCLPSFALTDSWGVDVNAHTAVQRTYKQGETWELRVALRDGLKPLNLTGATARFYWYTNSTDNVWWTNSATVYAPALGVVSAPWTPAMDTGASSYAYWFGIWMPGSTSPLWRVTGTIRLLPSPGFTPNAQPVPVRTLDFSAITLTNAPWVTSADWQSGSNALAAALQDLSGRVDAIPPPPVVPVDSVNGLTGAVTITAASLGALTAEADTAALSALAAFAGTNRVTILRDAGDASVWWVAHGGTNLTAYTLAMSWVVRNEALTVIEGENPPFAARSTPRPDIPYPLPAEGYWALDGEITIGTLDGWVSAWLPDTTAWGAAPFASSDHYTLIPISNELIGNIYLDYQSVTNLVGSYNLTTGNVWQAVSAVQQTADAALLAADQAATLINYHAAMDAAPHAGKFVTPAQMTNNTSHILSQWYAADGSLTQQIVRAGTEIYTNWWPAGLSGAITNGYNGQLTFGPNYQGTPAVYIGTPYAPDWDEIVTVAAPFKIRSGGVLVGYVGGGDFGMNWTTIVGRNGGVGGRTDCTILTYDANGAVLQQTLGDTVVNTLRAGGLCIIGDSLSVAKTNSAAVIRSMGPLLFGPVINGKQQFLDGDGTNAWHVDVNSVTNWQTNN